MSAPASMTWFWAGCLLEGALAAAAVVLGWLTGVPVLAGIKLHWGAIACGSLAVIPMFVFFQILLRSPIPAFRRIRQFLEAVVRPLFSSWSWWQLALISLLAGVGEELLFRGFVQDGLSGYMGTPMALVLASVCFGFAHFVNMSYALVASFIGLYLGGLWLLTGNLLVPMVAHAVYDFLALVYFLRYVRPVPPQALADDPNLGD